MTYATVDQLAVALNDPRLATTQTDVLQACLDASAAEIDAYLDCITPLAAPFPELIIRTNVNRAVEWYKAPDAAYGGVGFDQIGKTTLPSSGFGRHAAVIVSLKQRWGVG
jgi:phage gp36-like protein